MAASLDIEQVEQLTAYLARTGMAGESLSVRKLEGGVSNRIVLVKTGAGRSFVVKQALDKLRTAVDWYSEPRRIVREARGTEWLAKVAPEAIPPLLFEDPDQHVIAIAAVAEPHRNWKSMLLAGEVDFSLVARFAELLATIHVKSWEQREAAGALFEDRTFFETLRLEPYYRYSASQEPETAAFYDALIEETLATRVAVVHGDYSPKNVLIREGHLVLLDHEVIHFGDPAFDVGFSLTHLLAKAGHVAGARADLAAAAELYGFRYLRAIADVAWAADVEARAVRHTLGCLLGRVVGRSPLEYLTEEERGRQASIAKELMGRPPATLREMVREYVERLHGR